MKYFTSDTHYFHKNVIEHCARPYDLLEDMHESYIDKWNSKVTIKDEIYHVGDFSFGSVEKTESILKRLKGRKHLIYGNHDKVIRKSSLLQSYFESCSDYKELKIEDQSHVSGYNKICLSHFPFLTWNSAHHGSMMIHGHSHSNLKYPFDGRILDVGVDGNDGELWSLEEVLVFMNNKPIHKIDHH